MTEQGTLEWNGFKCIRKLNIIMPPHDLFSCYTSTLYSYMHAVSFGVWESLLTTQHLGMYCLVTSPAGNIEFLNLFAIKEASSYE